MDQNLFRELIAAVKKLADENGGALNTVQIDTYFAQAGLEEGQMKLIYDYLNAQGINIAGYKGSTESAELKAQLEAERDIADAKTMLGIESAPDTEIDDSEEEENLFQEFLESIAKTPETDSLTEQMLFDRVAAGDSAAVKELTDIYLPQVCDLAGEYEGKGMSVEDLVQEASMGLLIALSSLEKMDSLAVYQASLLNAVSNHLEEAVKENSDQIVRDGALAEKVNHLNDAAKALTEELGHAVSVEELSAYLEIPAEELREVMKLAGHNLQL